MHSLAMAENILQSVLKEAEKNEGKCIKAIDIKIKEEDFIEADSLQFCLEAMAKGTIAEGAHVDIKLADASEEPQITLDLD